MEYNSLQFLLFLAATFTAFYLAADRYRWIVLLLASIGFYAALGAPYLLVALGLVAVVTYGIGMAIGRSDDPGRKRTLFWCGVSANLAVLVCLKYLPSMAAHYPGPFMGAFGESALRNGSLLLSVGVSYYVFQAISYLIDVYAGIGEPETHFGYFALYLGFFPKLLQGPIERAGELLPQLKNSYVFDYDSARAGLLLFAWGLFKKIVIADRLGLYVDSVYGDVHSFTGLPLVLATWFYAGQLYYDFSGYTDMALGVARLFNVRLTQNFNAPYMATSIADFWRRWHISFSRWLLDYLFKPLQMRFRDAKTAGNALALLLTFLACGIWHGASMTFIAWGALHGVFMAASVITGRARGRLHTRLNMPPAARKAWGAAVAFNLVCFAWIFFRANGIGDAIYVATHLFSGVDGAKSFLLSQGKTNLVVAALSVIAVAAASSRDREAIAGRAFLGAPAFLRWPAYYLLLISIFWFAADQQGRFIYFRF